MKLLASTKKVSPAEPPVELQSLDSHPTSDANVLSVYSKKRNSSTRVFSIIILISFGCSILFLLSTLIVYIVLYVLTGKYTKLKESASKVQEYDLVLTTSALLSVWTKNASWVDRYNEYVPMLSGNLSLVLSLVPENVANQFKQTDDANNALVEMETIALDSCLSGNYSIGRNVLASAEYAANKTIYSNGLQYVKAYIGQTEQTTQNVQAALVLLLSLIMLIIGLLVVATYYLQRRSAKYIEREKEQADALLGSILPENIVDRLKQGETKIADSHQDVALMFSDIVGFTPLSSVMSVGEIVELLNQIFCAFDKYAKQFNIEKIKTVSFNRITDKKIGDGYMCVDFSCNVENMVRFANKCLKHVKMLNEKLKLPAALNIRIGMHTGPAISGIIGQSKIAFDVWGDSVNVASRMESASEPGHLQLSAAAYAKVSYCSDLQFVEREIYVKGKGQQQAYLLMHEAAWSPMSEFDSEADFLLNSKK